MCPDFVKLSILDDQEDVCDLLSRYIKMEVPNATVRAYSNVGQFLKEYEETKDDIVILDFDLGLLTANDIADKIEEINPNVTIFIMSAWLESGSEFCIAKPFENLRTVAEKICQKTKEYSNMRLERFLMLDAALTFLQFKKEGKIHQCHQKMTV